MIAYYADWTTLRPSESSRTRSGSLPDACRGLSPIFPASRGCAPSDAYRCRTRPSHQRVPGTGDSPGPISPGRARSGACGRPRLEWRAARGIETRDVLAGRNSRLSGHARRSSTRRPRTHLRGRAGNGRMSNGFEWPRSSWRFRQNAKVTAFRDILDRFRSRFVLGDFILYCCPDSSYGCSAGLARESHSGASADKRTMRFQ
jgi:hypothetical protein